MKNNIFICPATGSKLSLFVTKEENGIIKEGFYQNTKGRKYLINDSIPDFTYPAKLSDKQKEQHRYYEMNAENYDDIQWLTFAIQNEDEEIVRKKMVSYLNLKPHAKVLELSCGTGRDSVNIASLLDKESELFVQDLSLAMLNQCRKKLENVSVPVNYSVGNASYLAFPDHYFDAVFSFGGLNVFDNLKRSLQEMVRVTKCGGRIVVGDESMPPWLYDTEFGKTLLYNNPLFKFKVPLKYIPVEARDVSVNWIVGGVYYLISFTVGKGEPLGNFDLEIPGKRGGTLRTRYYGRLEGVTQETKKLVVHAAARNNQSIHQWLDRVLKSAIDKEFNKKV